MLTIVFTDLVDSTSVKATLPGSDLAERNRIYYGSILAPHRARIEAARRRFEGRLVDQIGDSFFLVFESVSAAATFAIDIQKSHADDPLVTPLGNVRVRIGMHTGEPLADPDGSGRLVGQEVDYAARLCSLAEGGQVILSDATSSLLRDCMLRETRSHAHGDRLLKGIGLVPIFELLFEGRSPSPLREAAIAPDNLAPPPPRVAGRAGLLAELRERLHAGGVVVLQAEGGMGKTTLALAVAHEMLRAGECPGGACWVNCETGPGLDECLRRAAAVFFGDPSDSETSEALAKRIRTHLSDRRAVLILDNFETVAGDADILRWLSAFRPPARILITTRVVPPGLPGRVVPVLELLRADAAGLLRTRSAQAGVSVVPPDDAVDALCALVGDQPLAVELLAVRLARTPVLRLLEQLGKGLAVLDAKGDPNRPPRHQSAKACVTGSFSELAASARDLMLRMCVLPSGFDSRLIDAVVGRDDWDDDAGQLRAMSLWRLTGELYGMHPLVRQYACEQLGDARGETERRAVEGVAWVLASLSEDYRPGPGFAKRSRRYLTWCDDHLPNVAAAVEIARTYGMWGIVPKIARAMQFFWNTRGHWPVADKIGAAVLEAAAALGDPSIAAYGHNNLGIIHRHQGRNAEAIADHLSGIALCDAHPDEIPPQVRANLHARLGKVYLIQSRFEEAQTQLLRAVELYRREGDRVGESISLVYSGQNTKFLNDWTGAVSNLEVALALVRADGNLPLEREILYQLGDTRIKLEEYDTARRELTASAELARALGDREAEAKAVSNLGMISLFQGEPDAAREHLLAALAIHRETGYRSREGRALRRLGQIELASGHRELALSYARRSVEVLKTVQETNGLKRAQEFLTRLEQE